MTDPGADPPAREPLRLQVLDKLAALMTAAFGLVAALAWNDAIKAVLDLYLGPDSQVRGLLLYATLVTLVAILASIWIAAATNRARKRLAPVAP